jgi:sporulation protein YunB
VAKFKFKKRPLRNGPLPLKYTLLIGFIIFNLFTAQGLWIINKGIEPSLMSIAETKTRQIAAQAINDAISKKIADDIDINELIVIHENSNGEAVGYSFNPKIYNRVTSEANIRVQKYLDYVEAGELEKLQSFKNDINIDYEQSRVEKGIVYYIPIGRATNNTLLSNLGPRVPVRFEILGAVTTDIETVREESGINNTYLDIYIIIKVQMNVVVPFSKRNIEVSNRVKLGDLFLEGDVPDYYNGNGNSAFPPVVIPPPTKQN